MNEKINLSYFSPEFNKAFTKEIKAFVKVSGLTVKEINEDPEGMEKATRLAIANIDKANKEILQGEQWENSIFRWSGEA